MGEGSHKERFPEALARVNRRYGKALERLAAPGSEGDGAPPNLLLLTSDQQHYDTLGVANPRIHTPALDRLAAEGVRFTRAYTCNPVCSPTRASIITGLYPSQHHCWTIGVKLPEDVPTVGDVLQSHGYATALIGKAHLQPLASRPGSESLECHPTLRDLDFWRGFHGPWYGFQHVEVSRNHADEHLAGQHYAIWLQEQGLKDWRDHFRRWPPEEGEPWRQHAWSLPEEYHYSRWTADRTIARLEEYGRAGRPFFLWASFHDPHPPYLVPEPWASMYDPDQMVAGRLTPGEHDANPPYFRLTQEERPDFSAYRENQALHGFHSHLVDPAEGRRRIATYYGMISLLDHHLGRILAALDRLGLAGNTLVVFTTDHGHFLGQHGLWAKGAFHYEDLLRVPFLVRWPGRLPAGEVRDTLESLVDLAPTFLGAAGLPVPGLMTGLDRSAAWRGESAAQRAHVIVENRHGETLMHLRTCIGRRYKLTVHRGHEYGELFDLEQDPAEVHNRWADPAYAALKADLLHQFLLATLECEPTRMPRIAGA